ncbi:SpoVA/SpoVAEb family sporulation membrane protein [Geobacillus thermoleovorans]|uniref:SpoVA/SpoVAEb family sporulation membrane protein n=1 Tax=Geobacillus thermoleovorans TaxID=33941 RepID=UPI00272EBF2F|nr:SpoVA/SpoVAEb family sporulation membrane protein [Geobacillus thermoleovorans]
MEYVRAFLAGGLLCAIVQLIIDRGKWTPAGVAGSLVVFGVLLGFGGVYDPFVAWAGAGATMRYADLGIGWRKGPWQNRGRRDLSKPEQRCSDLPAPCSLLSWLALLPRRSLANRKGRDDGKTTSHFSNGWGRVRLPGD